MAFVTKQKITIAVCLLAVGFMIALESLCRQNPTHVASSYWVSAKQLQQLHLTNAFKFNFIGFVLLLFFSRILFNFAIAYVKFYMYTFK